MDSLETTAELFGGLCVDVVLRWSRWVPYRPGTYWEPSEGGYVEDLDVCALVGPSPGPTLNPVRLIGEDASESLWADWLIEADEYAAERDEPEPERWED